jgi:hypothetical protein
MTPEQARQACIEKNKWVNDLKTPEGFVEMTKVIETYLADGDETYWWSSVDEALESGRFEYLEEELDEEEMEDIENSKSVKELIEKVGFPFFLG